MSDRLGGFTVARLEYEDGTVVECGDCGWWGDIEESEVIEDCYLDVGGEVPGGRCPECGALCYAVDANGLVELAIRKSIVSQIYREEGLDV